jgi:predicted SnoaL-like aldol condensation-catalyzing enzyme
MNERIRLLKHQATLVETYTSHDGSVHEGKSVDLEKFAELIVRECINAVYDDGQDAEYYQNRIARRFNINLID